VKVWLPPPLLRLCRLCWAALLLCGLALSAQALPPPLPLSPTTEHLPLAGHMERHIDPGGQQTLDEVRAQGQFAAVPSFATGGYTAAAHWYRFTLARTAASPAHWLLECGAAYLDDIQVFVPQADGRFAEHRLGDHVPFAQRPLQTPLHTLKLDLPATPLTLYVRVHSTSSLVFFSSVWRADTFTAKESQENFYQGLFFGMLVLTILMYGLLGSWLRDANLLVYAAYVVTLLLFYLGSKGYAALLFAPTDGRWLDATTGLGVIGGGIAAVLMWNQFLDLKQHFPRLRQVVFLCIVPMCGALLGIASPVYRELAPYTLLLSNTLAWLLTGVLLWRLVQTPRQPILWLYLFAFLAATLGVALQSAMATGLVPLNPFTANSYQIGSFVHILALNLALAWRVKNMQAERLHAEHEAATSRAKAQEQRQLVAMLSHEFRNPLAAISRSAQMLLLDVDGPTASRLEGIRDNADSLYALVDKFLAVESLDGHAAMLSRQATRLQALVAAALRGCEGSARVAVNITPQDARFSLDRSLFGIALGNLIGNALAYSLQDTLVNVHVKVNAKDLEITVIDKGMGMSGEDLARLGTPYFRAAAAQKTRGIGLGFVLARKIVTAHGGTLDISSAPEQGTTVTIRLRSTPLVEKTSQRRKA
jgi:signal transduction histidine kinase